MIKDQNNEEESQKKKPSSNSAIVFENMSPWQFAKFATKSTINKSSHSISSSNPQSFLASAQSLSDEELQVKYEKNPLFRKRINAILAKNTEEIKLKKKTSLEEEEEKIIQSPTKTSKQVMKEESAKLTAFCVRCRQVLNLHK